MLQDFSTYLNIMWTLVFIGLNIKKQSPLRIL